MSSTSIRKSSHKCKTSSRMVVWMCCSTALASPHVLPFWDLKRWRRRSWWMCLLWIAWRRLCWQKLSCHCWRKLLMPTKLLHLAHNEHWLWTWVSLLGIWSQSRHCHTPIFLFRLNSWLDRIQQRRFSLSLSLDKIGLERCNKIFEYWFEERRHYDCEHAPRMGKNWYG